MTGSVLAAVWGYKLMSDVNPHLSLLHTSLNIDPLFKLCPHPIPVYTPIALQIPCRRSRELCPSPWRYKLYVLARGLGASAHVWWILESSVAAGIIA